MLVFNSNNFEHFFHVEDKIFKIVILLDDLVDGERDPNDPLAFHVVCDLILF